MNGRPLTEAQISQALRAHLPKRAQAGLHEQILVAVDTTAQQRALPSLLGALQDADPGARRRNLLFAAALLIALAIAAAAAAGAWLPKQDVAPDLSLLPPADPQALPSPSLTAPSAAPTALAFPRTTGVWVSTNSMGTRRLDNTAVRLLDGRVLVVGGADDDTSAELYDPATGTWSSTGSMIKPPEGFKATLLLDGRVLVGDVEGAEVYDPDSGTWTATGSMVATDPVGRQFEFGDVAARRQSARGPLRRRHRVVRPRHRDLDRHGAVDTTHGHPHAGHAARWQGARGGRRRHLQ